jgi:hypothetical protein
MPMPSRAVYLAVTVVAFAGCGGAKTLVFRDGGIEFSYPPDWSVSGFSRTVSPARLVVSSYKVTRGEVEGDCGGSRALAALPRSGAALLLIDYGTAAAGRGWFAPRPTHLRIRRFARANYECFGDSYMLRVRAAGHDLQAFVQLGEDASAVTSAHTLQILDSVKRP